MRLEQHVWNYLKASIHDSLFHICEGEVVIEEHANDGYAKVSFVIPPGAVCIQWKIQAHDLFKFLKRNVAADGAFILQLADGSYEAHIVECKRTIDQYSWKHVKDQWMGSMYRLRALAGIMDIQFKRMVFYTAFREDALEPGLAKLLITGSASDSAQQPRVPKAVQQQLSWQDTEIKFPASPTRFPHRKVKLDDKEGTGRVDLG